jgi:hypothetical protein
MFDGKIIFFMGKGLHFGCPDNKDLGEIKADHNFAYPGIAERQCRGNFCD